MAFSEDISAFFTDFAETVTVNGKSVKGIYDSSYSEIEGIGGAKQMLSLVYSDYVASGASEGSTVIINGISYKIAYTEPEKSDNIIDVYLSPL